MRAKKSYVVLIDARDNNGHVIALEDKDGNIAQFETYEKAEDAVDHRHILFGIPMLIVCMDGD